MKFEEYRDRDALGLAELIRDGEVTAREVLDAALTAIDAANPALNAVITLDEAGALRAVDAGLPDGPFAGVPFAIKGLWTAVEGLPMGNGSKLYDGVVASYDAEQVRRYREAGLVVLGLTNSPEFGLAPTTEPVRYGPTHNPWRLGFSPGGSSGGAAAAVASGMLPMAHATDGGGSIRIPAAYCGLFGLKPTRSRMSFAPDRGDGWNGMSTTHVVSRSVRDSAAALDATAGNVPGDPYAAPPAPASYLAEVAAEPGRLRIGLITDAPSGVPVDAALRAAAERSASRCEALGHIVTPMSWPAAAAQAGLLGGAIISAHIAAAVDARLAELGRAQLPDDLEPVAAAIAARGRTLSGPEHVAAVQAMHAFGRAIARLYEDVDVLITPTVGRVAFAHGVLSGQDMQRFAREVGPVATFTSLANLTGQPAMSLPLDQDEDGMPLGTQVIGRFGDEATLLRLAGQLERAHPWFDRVPPGR